MLQCSEVTTHCYEQQIFIHVNAETKVAVSLFCTAAISSGQCILGSAVLQCSELTAQWYREQTFIGDMGIYRGITVGFVVAKLF